MIQVGAPLRAAINAVANRPADLYELYLDDQVLFYSEIDITWGGNHYLPQVLGRSSIKRYMSGQFDGVSVTFSNVDTTLAQVLLENEIEGRRLVIRKIDQSVADDSIVLFDGRMERPSRISETEAILEAKHVLGSIDFDAPARLFSDFCPWDFKGLECGYVGPETECNKSWARCNQIAQTHRYGGFRFIPHGGKYQYTEVETKRFLLLFKRKKSKQVWADYSAVDDTPYDVPIPIVYGRVQLAGIVIQHEDQGDVTKALVAFCIGKVRDIFYLRANEVLVTDYTHHYGTFGGGSDQLTDPRFPNAYPYSQVAYMGITIPSEVRAVDPAPNVTGIIMGRQVALFNAAGVFTHDDWSDNPVWCTRDFLTLPLAQGGMGVPESLMDDGVNYETAAYCDALIQDATNDQKIFSPVNLPEGFAYERYRSTGVDGIDPDVDGPYSEFQPGVDDDTSTEPAPVNVRRFTMNVALAKSETAVDILFKKLLPSFRGYMTQSAAGNIQIRCERPVKNSAVTATSAVGAVEILCSNSGQWAPGDLVLASPFTARAEALTVDAVLSDRLVFSGPAFFTHIVGDTLMHIAMAFNDSNMVGRFEYPLTSQQSSTNRVTIKYIDAPAGFQEKELHVNDYAHQAAVRKVNNEEADGGAIDSFFQAYRIGQWLRAKRRDLGKFCSFSADMKATLLEVGDVVAVSAVEVGLQAVPFMVQELSLEPNDELSILGQLYSLDAYSDVAPQCTVTVPTVFPRPTDADVPPQPIFGLSAGRRGTVDLAGVAFESLANTKSISSGTLSLHYWDELSVAAPPLLAAAVSNSAAHVDLTTAGTAVEGQLIQIGPEVMRVTAVQLSGTRYQVVRNIDDSGAVAHNAGDVVYELKDLTVTAPFPKNFFGTELSGSWKHSIPLPDVRVAVGEFYVENDRGKSPIYGAYFTHNDDLGLRTLSGGQYSIQVSGYLAVQESTAPALLIEDSHAVRDVYAVLGREADAPIQIRLRVDGDLYCTLNFFAGLKVSDAVDGNSLPPLMAGSHLTADILSVGSTYPGADLTVLIRL